MITSELGDLNDPNKYVEGCNEDLGHIFNNFEKCFFIKKKRMLVETRNVYLPDNKCHHYPWLYWDATRKYAEKGYKWNERGKDARQLITLVWHNDVEKIEDTILNNRISGNLVRCNMKPIKDKCITLKGEKSEINYIASYKNNIEYVFSGNINFSDSKRYGEVFEELSICMEKAIDDYYKQRESGDQKDIDKKQ
jgi:hypothetical protein